MKEAAVASVAEEVGQAGGAIQGVLAVCQVAAVEMEPPWPHEHNIPSRLGRLRSHRTKTRSSQRPHSNRRLHRKTLWAGGRSQHRHGSVLGTPPFVHPPHSNLFPQSKQYCLGTKPHSSQRLHNNQHLHHKRLLVGERSACRHGNVLDTHTLQAVGTMEAKVRWAVPVVSGCQSRG